jgi:hypothetical protein
MGDEKTEGRLRKRRKVAHLARVYTQVSTLRSWKKRATRRRVAGGRMAVRGRVVQGDADGESCACGQRALIISHLEQGRVSNARQ